MGDEEEVAEFGLSPRSSETAQGKQFWILAPTVWETLRVKSKPFCPQSGQAT